MELRVRFSMDQAAAFRERFGFPHEYTEVASGRVNLIGEHIDYQGGVVCPVAIDRTLTILAGQNSRSLVVESTSETGEPLAVEATQWLAQSYGVELPAWSLLIDSTVPVGSGLSSSAALLVALIRWFSQVHSLEVTDEDIPGLVQRIEHEVRGVSCGLMDPTAIVFSRPGHFLRFHAQTGAKSFIPFPSTARLIIFDTETPRSLTGSDYNRCVRLAQRAAEKLQVESLAEYRSGNEHLLSHDEALVVAHHKGEGRRVEEFCRAMKDSDLTTAGRLMTESHGSLRDNLGVSCKELESFVEIANQCEGVFGARLTGAGFGGCGIALVEAKAAPPACETINQHFHERHNRGQGWVSDMGFLSPDT